MTTKQTKESPKAMGAEVDLSLEELEMLVNGGFDDEIVEGDDTVSIDEDVKSSASLIASEPTDELSLENLDSMLAGIEDEVVAESIAVGEAEKGGEIEESLLAGAILELSKPAPVVKEKPVRKTPSARVSSHSHSREEIVKERADSKFYLLDKSDLELDKAGQEAKHKEVMATINKMNVKTGAKCLNLLAHVNGRGELSTFIKSGVNYILTADKITSSDFVDYFCKSTRNKVKSYSKGTASPQATNLLRLFSELHMIVKSHDCYVVNKNSLLVEKLQGKGGAA